MELDLYWKLRDSYTDSICITDLYDIYVDLFNYATTSNLCSLLTKTCSVTYLRLLPGHQDVI